MRRRPLDNRPVAALAGVRSHRGRQREAERPEVGLVAEGRRRRASSEEALRRGSGLELVEQRSYHKSHKC